VTSLNPALEDVHYCARCGNAPDVAFPRSITCQSCGYGAFYSPKPVACGIKNSTSG
jgi:predicted nucleic-acid-binding Zn-ribbon protein